MQAQSTVVRSAGIILLVAVFVEAGTALATSVTPLEQSRLKGKEWLWSITGDGYTYKVKWNIADQDNSAYNIPVLTLPGKDEVALYEGHIWVTPSDAAGMPGKTVQFDVKVYVYSVKTEEGGTYEPYILKMPYIDTSKVAEKANEAILAQNGAGETLLGVVDKVEGGNLPSRHDMNQAEQTLRKAQDAGEKATSSEVVFTQGTVTKNGGTTHKFGFLVQVPVEDRDYKFFVTRNDSDLMEDDDGKNLPGLGILNIGGKEILVGKPATFTEADSPNVTDSLQPTGNYGTVTLAGKMEYKGNVETFSTSLVVKGPMEADVIADAEKVFKQEIGLLNSIKVAYTAGLAVLRLSLAAASAGLTAALLLKVPWLIAAFAALVVLVAATIGVWYVCRDKIGEIIDTLQNDLTEFKIVEATKLPI